MKVAFRSAHVADLFLRTNIVRLLPRRPKALNSSVRERREELARFYDNFECLVEVLCDGANYGPVQKLEIGYESLRDFLPADFARLRPFLGAYASPDAFESLWKYPTLREMLESDDGGLISAIIDTRHALTMYAEHLRQLAATAA